MRLCLCRNHVLLPDDATESIRSPMVASFLENVPLRDLALHEQHAACVDARGDVYQWGDGFYDASSNAEPEGRGPKLTLSGKVCLTTAPTTIVHSSTVLFQLQNITEIKLTDSRLFALSSSGKVYVLSSQASRQNPSPAVSSGSPWWGTGWLWGDDALAADFIELKPSDALSRGEKYVIPQQFSPPILSRLPRFVSIAAGRDHLLALTSSGRTFAHPINKNANTHGQLGFRKFDIPDPSSPSTSTTSSSSSRMNVELTPRSAIDPHANKARYTRQNTRANHWFESGLPGTSEQGAPAAPAPEDRVLVGLSNNLVGVSENLAGVDDDKIGFCDKLFEVPSLKGVRIEQIAAGARSSYVKTDTGRVLGWGANEYGCVRHDLP